MTQRTPHIRRIYIPFFFILLSALMIFIVTGCGNDDAQLSRQRDQKAFSNPSNSASFGIVWPKKSIADSDSPTLACNELGIVTVSVDVYDAADVHLTDASFACRDGEGIIENIPPGSNRKFVISGKGPQGNIIYQGVKDNITIVTNGHTNVGYIELLPITLAVISTIPADQAINVGLRTTISATFSKAIAAESLTPDTVLVNDGTSNISGEISCAGRAVSFTPNRELDYNKRYTVTLTTGVKDHEGNALSAPFSWTFVSLENIPPTVTEFYPGDAARGVGIFPTITAVFSEPMDAETINPETFLVQAQSNSDTIDIAGQVTYDDSTQQAIFLPADNLPCDSRLTVTLSGGMTDAVGNQMVERRWQFTTTERCGGQIAACNGHTVAIKNDGTLWAWGNNYYGQLGDGTFDNKDMSIQIGADTDWSAVAGSDSQTFALKTDGTLWAWGSNEHGHLGDDTLEDKNVPIQIGKDNNWSMISAGSYHTVALKTDGTLWTWGGDEFESNKKPMQIGNDTNWLMITAGTYCTFALKMNGTLWAWGHNESGQLGDGTYDVKNIPIQIGGDIDWALVTANSNHSLALKKDGTLWGWGNNDTGQLGDGTLEDKILPTQIGSDSNWSVVSTGIDHTVALKNDGTLWVWGRNNFGQLGDGTFEDKVAPIQVGDDDNWSAILARGGYTLAAKTDGTLWAWGSNYFGQLGDSTYENRNAPTQVITDSKWVDVVAGGRHTVALKTDNTIWAWGEDVISVFEDGTGRSGRAVTADRPIQIGSDTDWTAVVAAGGRHSMALKTDGTVWAWGDNTYGQLGDGTAENCFIPKQIGIDLNWSGIVAGGREHSVALKTDGTLWAWGSNSNGQLGDGSFEDKLIPIQIGSDIDWLDVATGYVSTIALKIDGTLWGWGYLGVETTEDNSIPNQVGMDTNWLSVAAGATHFVALKTDDTLWAWGENSNGQIGDGTFENKDFPIQVGTDTYWLSVTAGASHCIALKKDGTLWAWGYNYFGQLGNGTYGSMSGGNNIPIQIGNDTDWSEVTAGAYHSVALKVDGSLWSWGSYESQYGPTENIPTRIDLYFYF